MRRVGSVQKYPGKGRRPKEMNHINSKEKNDDELLQIRPIMNYDDIPDGVYNFSGLSELQHRRTKPNLKENAKVHKSKFKKEKPSKNKKKIRFNEQRKNIVEELFEAKVNNEQTFIKDFIVEDIPEEKKESEIIKKDNETIKERLELILQKDSIQKIKENNEEIIEDNVEIKESSKEAKKEEIVNEVQEKAVDPQEIKKEIELKLEEFKKQNEEVEITSSNPNTEGQDNYNLEPLKEDKAKEEDWEEDVEDSYEEDEIGEEEYDEEDVIDKFFYWITPSKEFAFLIMLFLGIITQISYLATSRANNLSGLLAITISAVSLVLLVNILNIQNKILIFISSLILVLLPVYNNILTAGNNAILYSLAILLAVSSLNLIFANKNKILCFILAVIIFAIGFKLYIYSRELFLVISIIKIIKDMFNRKEKISQFLIHCTLICVILVLGILI